MTKHNDERYERSNFGEHETRRRNVTTTDGTRPFQNRKNRLVKITAHGWPGRDTWFSPRSHNLQGPQLRRTSVAFSCCALRSRSLTVNQRAFAPSGGERGNSQARPLTVGQCSRATPTATLAPPRRPHKLQLSAIAKLARASQPHARLCVCAQWDCASARWPRGGGLHGAPPPLGQCSQPVGGLLGRSVALTRCDSVDSQRLPLEVHYKNYDTFSISLFRVFFAILFSLFFLAFLLRFLFWSFFAFFPLVLFSPNFLVTFCFVTLFFYSLHFR